MAVDDDLAAVGELDFEHVVADPFKVQIGAATLQPGLDLLQRCVGKRVEFAIIHPVLTFPVLAIRPMRQYLALALLATLALAGCGSKGGLTLPPKPVATTPSPSPATAASDSSTSTAPESTEKSSK
jgi:predicted small lipoprotein YifL